MPEHYRYGYTSSIPFRSFPKAVTAQTIAVMDASEARTFHIRRLVEAAGGPAAWSRTFGGTRWQQPQVSQWLSETNAKPIGNRLARDLETAQGLPRGSLDIPPTDELARISPRETPAAYVRFPLLEGFAGMGRGDYVGDYPEIVDFVEVTREWANEKLRNVPHEAVRVITGRGQSMRGTYNNGDLIFLDSRVKQFTADAAYCYRWNGLVHVKRLQQIGRDMVRIISANPAWPPVDVPLTDLEIGGIALAAWTLTEF